MSQFGITAIRWNTEHTEVENCMVHELEPRGRGCVLLDGKPMWYTDVASLIAGGDKVWVMQKNTEGECERVAPVRVRDGLDEYLQSSPEDALFDLPTF